VRLNDDKRQKNQLQQMLAFPETGRSEASESCGRGTESSVAKHKPESPASSEQLMEEICQAENGKQAWTRVQANKGSAGIDGMTVEKLPDYLNQHWPEVREQLLNGTYKPQPVKRVEIPKPDGGCCRFYNAVGTRPSRNTAMGFDPDARHIRQLPKHNNT
jgi:hypothetical protein